MDAYPPRWRSTKIQLCCPLTLQDIALFQCDRTSYLGRMRTLSRQVSFLEMGSDVDSPVKLKKHTRACTQMEARDSCYRSGIAWLVCGVSTSSQMILLAADAILHGPISPPYLPPLAVRLAAVDVHARVTILRIVHTDPVGLPLGNCSRGLV